MVVNDPSTLFLGGCIGGGGFHQLVEFSQKKGLYLKATIFQEKKKRTHILKKDVGYVFDCSPNAEKVKD